MDGITVKAPAKINLFLEVCERMADGYHKIESIMQSVTLYDILTVKKQNSGLHFDCNNKKLVYDGNLVLSAVKLFLEKTGIKDGISVFLEKRIPVSAGLGGGSSDAAATLLALNSLFGDPLPMDILYAIGKRLGADVPFCIKKGICRASGIGEKLFPLPHLPQCFFVIAKGDTSILTKEAFEQMDKHENRKIKSPDKMTEMIYKGDLSAICRCLYNGFEINGSYNEKIKSVMRKHNAKGALMSGSGPSVFGVFENESDAKNAESDLKTQGYECFLCTPEK